MADEERKERVTIDDVVEVLAKHSATPNDPDDANTLSRFNTQVTEDRQSKESSASDRKESTQGGSQPTGTQRKDK